MISGSGSTVVDVQGSQGQLFSVTDDLTGTLFTVSDISGIPILSVSSSATTIIDNNIIIGENSSMECFSPSVASSILGGSSHCIKDDYSTIAGGCDNCIEGCLGSIVGGSGNHICHSNTGVFIGGGCSNNAGFCSTMNAIVGGCGNTVNGPQASPQPGRYNIIGAGKGNSNSGGTSGILAGDFNLITSEGTGGSNVNSSGSFIGAGARNIITAADNTAIVAGCLNSSSADYSFIGGGAKNSITSNSGFIGGGCLNEVGLSTGTMGVIVGGLSNSNASAYGFIGGGRTNTIDAYNTDSLIVGGSGNTIHANGFSFDTSRASIVGGCNNTIQCISDCSFLGGGCGNTINCNSVTSFIGGGCGNTIGATTCAGTVVGGISNSASGAQAFIGGGRANATNSTVATIVGGCSNTVSGGCSFIGGGCANTISGQCSGILGGVSNSTQTKSNAFIIGSGIIALGSNTTFVNNLGFYGSCNQSALTGTDKTSGELIYTGNTSVTKGYLYYLTEPTSGNSGWALADADAVSTGTNMLAIAADTGNSYEVGMLVRGFARFASRFNLTGGTIGSPLYMSTTAGDITLTAPSGTGDIVRVVGHLIDDALELIYFNPDGAWVEIA